MSPIEKYYSKDDALILLQKYCIYQDRCHSEVRTRLLKAKIYGDDLEDIIVDLIQEGYLNEERYARAYVRGKYRIKSWGRYKIERYLKQKKVSEYCIRHGMKEIVEEEYQENLQRLLNKRADIRPCTSQKQLVQELIKYAITRGYSYEESRYVADTIAKNRYCNN